MNTKLQNKQKKISSLEMKNFKKDLNVLKANLKNQDTFNQTVAKIITNIDIKEEKDNKDVVLWDNNLEIAFVKVALTGSLK